MMSSTSRRFNISLNRFTNLVTHGEEYTHTTPELSKGLGKRTFLALINHIILLFSHTSSYENK